jgi:AcrR family transcriptional regulator
LTPALPVDSLAAAAGVATGSLHRHFTGKADFFAALIRAELQRTAQRFTRIAAGDVDAATRALTAYVSSNHVEHPESGCPLPSLTAEVA